MFKKTGLIRLVLAVIIFPLLLLSCGKSESAQEDDGPLFSSFMDIPGVTEDEIFKIQMLQNQYDSFVYGMTP